MRLATEMQELLKFSIHSLLFRGLIFPCHFGLARAAPKVYIASAHAKVSRAFRENSSRKSTEALARIISFPRRKLDRWTNTSAQIRLVGLGARCIIDLQISGEKGARFCLLLVQGCAKVYTVLPNGKRFTALRYRFSVYNCCCYFCDFYLCCFAGIFLRLEGACESMLFSVNNNNVIFQTHIMYLFEMFCFQDLYSTHATLICFCYTV